MGWFSKAVSFVKNNASGIVHGVLDVAGFIPVVGAVADLANAAIYAAEGDYVNAALSAVSAIPGVGDAVAAASKTVKVVSKGVKVASNVKQGVRALDKIQDGLKVIKGKCTTGGSLLKKGKDDIKSIFDKIKKEAKKKTQPSKPKKTQSTQNKPGKNQCKRGEPVDVVTGAVFYESVDFKLPGIIPFTWERRYFSDSRRNGWLGYKTLSNMDTKIYQKDRNQIHILLPDGREAAVDYFEENTYVREEKISINSYDKGYTVFFHEDSLCYYYENILAKKEIFYLTMIKDSSDNKIEFFYQDNCLIKMIDSVGRILEVESDDKNRITSVRLGSRQLVSYRYNSNGDLCTVQDALGNKKKIYYENHLMVKTTTKDGYSFYWEYDGWDANARCIHTWGDDGTLEYHFEYQDGLTISTNALGYHEKIYYNYHNLITKHIDYEGNVTEYEYNRQEEIIAITDALKNKKLFFYDEKGNLEKRIDVNGIEISYQYDEAGKVIKIIYPNQGEKQLSYNEKGNIEKVVYPDGSVNLYYYNKQNLIHKIEDSLGNQVAFQYDQWANMIAIEQADGNSSRWEYDQFGNCIKETNSLGAETLYQYDPLNRVVKIKTPEGNTTKLRYNGSDDVISISDNQQTVEYEYTWSGKVTKRKELDSVIKYSYDPEERIKSVTLQNKETYLFEYDGVGNIIKETGFDGNSYQYAYDKLGNVVRVTQPDNSVKILTYDKGKQLIRTEYENGYAENFAYDNMGCLIQADNPFSTISLERDVMERIQKVTQDGHVIEYTYDKSGQRTAIKSSLGADIQQKYNETGDVIGLQADVNGRMWASDTKYNSLGQVLESILPGGLRSRWEYDKMGRPILQNIGKEYSQGSTYRYQWNSYNQLVEKIRDGFKISYQYDKYGQLESGKAGNQFTYRAFDILGNIYQSKEKKDRVYGTGGRLLQKGATKYEYDACGSLIKKTAEDGIWKYEYGCNGFMKKVVRPDKREVTFQYDVLGRRIAKSFDGKTTRFLWDGNVILHEWEESEQEKVKSPVTWLFDEKNFTPVAKITKEEAYSVISDHLGTPFAMYDTSSTKVWENELDIYGKIVSSEGDASHCYFRFPGQYEDVETGLYYNRFRYYDPDTGQYTQQDPIGLEGNNPTLYGYVGDPNILSDPLGLNEINIAGELGEQNAGIIKNTKRIPSASGKRKYRVPDGMDATERYIQEVKNVGKQHYSSQIKDDIAHVTRDGGTGKVTLIVDERTKLTSSLQEAIDDPKVSLELERKNLNDPH